MSTNSEGTWRFISFAEAEVERLPGKTHHWYCKPDRVPGCDLLFVHASLSLGQAHRFHYHPNLEEILYILSGTAEQWAESSKKILKPGDSFYVSKGVVHATFNIGNEPLDFLAILSPAHKPGPITVEVSDQEPWKNLRPEAIPER